MKASKNIKPAVWVTLLILASGGCAEREVTYTSPPPTYVREADGTEVIVNDAPPPPIIETTPVSPGPEFVWVEGAWIWRGHWVWERGRWRRPPQPGVVWVPHHYGYRDGRHVWVRGGWH